MVDVARAAHPPPGRAAYGVLGGLRRWVVWWLAWRVMPRRLSRLVARQGKLITVQLEARQTSPQRVRGLVMLYYPAHLVSLAALHSPQGEMSVAFPASSVGQATPAEATAAYQLLRAPWPVWQPGERRRATIALIPRVHQDLRLYLSVVLEPSAPAARPLR